MPSSKFRVGRSETGLGLFATKTIKKSAYIATYRGRRISSEQAEELENRGSRYMFELSSRWVIDGSKRYNVARYMNHSCRPNAEPFIIRARKIIFRASRTITGARRSPTITAATISISSSRRTAAAACPAARRPPFDAARRRQRPDASARCAAAHCRRETTCDGRQPATGGDGDHASGIGTSSTSRPCASTIFTNHPVQSNPGMTAR